MLIDRSHRPWIIATLAAAFAAGAGYALAAWRSGARPTAGSRVGLAFGIAGYALMTFAGLLALRKRFPTLRVGRAQTWMIAHIWLGLLALPLIVCHAGLRAGGELTMLLTILMFVVIGSGILGLVVQNTLPRMMMERVPLEVSYENIPNFLEQRRRFADDLVGSVCGPVVAEQGHPPGPEEFKAEAVARGPALLHHAAVAKSLAIAVEPAPGSEPLRDFYVHHVRPFLLGERRANGNARGLLRALFGQMSTVAAPEFHAILRTLQDICEERRQLLVQIRMHRWLHGWLLVHVPLGLALLLLGAVHALMSLRY